MTYTLEPSQSLMIAVGELPYLIRSEIGYVSVFLTPPAMWALTVFINWLKPRHAIPYQVACWTILALGILVRQYLLPGPPHGPSALWGSAAVALAVFPPAARVLRARGDRPGLEQVALPFSLGFFLNWAYVAAAHWIPNLPL
jgi:hypothetical protein